MLQGRAYVAPQYGYVPVGAMEKQLFILFVVTAVCHWLVVQVNVRTVPDGIAGSTLSTNTDGVRAITLEAGDRFEFL